MEVSVSAQNEHVMFAQGCLVRTHKMALRPPVLGDMHVLPSAF